MSSAVVALALGTLLAVGALAFVLFPLFFGVEESAPPIVAPAGVAGGRGEVAVAALREIEFDRATGKLSDADYEQLKTRYTKDALAAMRSGDVRAGAAEPVDEVEAAILAYRARHADCARCGPRPEPDAIFCSECGNRLAA